MKKVLLLTTVLIVSATILPQLTFAHQGSSGEKLGLAHYLTSPVHLTPLLMVAATAIYMIVKILGAKKS